ncbi:MAG: hypothetical protein ACLUE2_13430 [Bacteroides cellulosilyticus]
MQSQVGCLSCHIGDGKKIVTGGGNPFDIYPLGNGLHFDSVNRRLFRKEKAEFITRQASTLLLAFLKAENCNLSISEICDVSCGRMVVVLPNGYILLSEGCVPFLVEMCAGAVILNGDYHYRLKIPVSSEENKKIQNLT